jgi:hypothetical protein
MQHSLKLHYGIDNFSPSNYYNHIMVIELNIIFTIARCAVKKNRHGLTVCCHSTYEHTSDMGLITSELTSALPFIV